MLKPTIGAVILITFFLAQPAFSERFTYVLPVNGGNWDSKCSETGAVLFGRSSEDKRREVITKYNLPRNLQWHLGSIKNEWGDEKEENEFCYIQYANNIYIWRPFHFIFLPDKPIEVLQLGR